MKKVKVIYFLDRFLHGGIQSFVLENVKYMDKNKLQVDFLVLDDGNEYELEKTVIENGYSLYKLKGIWLRKLRDYIKYYKAADEFFSKHDDYDVIHLHGASKNFIILKIAKKYNIKVRIIHSHNIGFQTESIMQKALGNILKYFLKYYATDYFACSYLAGKWLFGKKIANNNLVVVKNGVDTDKFKYNIENRLKLRKELGVKNNFVVGHVGRFTHQKNHRFLIKIFKELLDFDGTARLLLVGSGPLEDEIKSQVKSLGIEDKVIFAGYRQNINEFMQAMDVFLFPSEFEGLGLVLVEAQAAGLRCFTSSNVVPEEVKISELLEFISLSEMPECWAKKILKKKYYERYAPLEDIKKSGFDIKETAKFLQNFYLEKYKEVTGEIL